MQQKLSELEMYLRDRFLERARREGVELVPLPAEYGLAFSYENPDEPVWPEVHLSRMLVNWRLQVVEIPGCTYDRYWCYENLSERSFAIAARALADWRGDPESEPTGWIRSWDGRRSR